MFSCSLGFLKNLDGYGRCFQEKEITAFSLRSQGKIKHFLVQLSIQMVTH